MANIIASMNQKGGSGKTTVIGLLAEFFALVRKLKVLLIDLDMQCNTTDQWVGMIDSPNSVGGQLPPKHPDHDESMGTNEVSTIADIFYGKPVLPYTSWLKEGENDGFVDVMCGHPKLLEEVNLKFATKDGSIDDRILVRLKDFLNLPEIQNTYDVILMDTGPSRNPIFRSAMRAATDIIIPFKPEEKDIQGINAMLQIIRQENFSRSKRKLSLIGLLPNMVRNTKLHETNLTEMGKGYKNALFPHNCWLSHLTAFPERDVKGIRPKSVYELPESSTAYKQAFNMANFVEQAIKNVKTSQLMEA
jgi:chromosome partitioning protein